MTSRIPLKELASLCPEVERQDLAEFLRRMPDRYFRDNPTGSVAEDATALSRIQGEGDSFVRFAHAVEDQVECIVYGFDSPALFSLIAGMLSATGFDIVDGTIHTYKRESVQVDPSRTGLRGRPGRRLRGRGVTRESPRKIIDRFLGRLPASSSYNEWCNSFGGLMKRVFALLADGVKDAQVSAARHLVYEEVSRALTSRNIDRDLVLLPVDMAVSPGDSGCTRISVVAEDTPFFLFALTNALSLQGVSIEGVRIRTTGSRVEDEIDAVGSKGEPLDTADQLKRIKLSVLLTKQFTYFLHGAPDPVAALGRFE